ncbi:MAG: 2-succinyl-6-hydroxy-2,4-cyclohexadiene-1-carboxylate synthase [Lentisphaerae bacterium]|nr:2-succinyl-6-hydroxy-2,4-cyclohexadiene-1-carboxylate synthase [Lentisphaerota bacterium]
MKTAIQLNVLKAGNPAAQPVVLLHGFLGSADDWDLVAADLARDCYCIAIDLPGHGGSIRLPNPASYTFAGAAEEIQEVLEDLRVANAVLAGYSMGGRLALQLAVQNPGRWRALVLESASPGLVDETDKLLRQAADEEWAMRLERAPFSDFLKSWYEQAMFSARATDSHGLDRMLARRRRNEPDELARAMRGLGVGHQPALWEQLGALTMPILLLAGEFDLKYVDVSERMQHLCRKASRVIVSSAGHNVHVDNPEAYLRAVRGFLLGLRAP